VLGSEGSTCSAVEIADRRAGGGADGMTTVTMRLTLRDKAGREHMTRAMADPGADNGLPASLDIPSSWAVGNGSCQGRGTFPQPR
jgi:hypothetical protein